MDHNILHLISEKVIQDRIRTDYGKTYVWHTIFNPYKRRQKGRIESCGYVVAEDDRNARLKVFNALQEKIFPAFMAENWYDEIITKYKKKWNCPEDLIYNDQGYESYLNQFLDYSWEEEDQKYIEDLKDKFIRKMIYYCFNAWGIPHLNFTLMITGLKNGVMQAE